MVLYKGGRPQKFTFRECVEPQEKPLAKLTTYGLGGMAKVYFPSNLWEAKRVYSDILSRGIVPEILGNGSDVLASDGAFDGEIICTRRLNGIVRVAQDRLLCLCGTRVSSLLNYCKTHSLGGLEYLVNIPATIGGIACMNGGAGGKYISENVVTVTLYDGKTVKLSNYDCHYSYKHSTMRDINAIILSILLKVEPSTRKEVEERLLKFSLRRKHLPKGKSCGCVFKNPPGDYAARLIECSGLKGARVGGAYVSKEHANFIINDGATSSEVFELIGIVKKTVKQMFGAELEEEVVYLGKFC